MKVEIINTGSELLLGRTVNTHQQWLCRRLSDRGAIVTRQMTVPDSGEAICDAVREALSRADVVLTTGGLGPTSDDLTREKVAALLGRKLREDTVVLGRIRKLFADRNRPMPTQVAVQALVPEGAVPLKNSTGTAPGLLLELDPNPFRDPPSKSLLILLPGPPRELQPMFDDEVIPLLGKAFSDAEPFSSCLMRTTGVPESALEEKIAGPLAPLVSRGLEVGYCSRPGEVDVSLSMRGSEASVAVADAAEIVRGILAGNVFSEADEALESVVVGLLTDHQLTLACAESCTGGLISHRITNVPGASAVLLASLVTYSNAAKLSLLGVDPPLLERHGAVSEAVCEAMADGVRRRTGASLGLAVTGIAGPGGGSVEKPVGTVFLGISDARGTRVEHRNNRWDRATFKQVTSQQALDLVRRRVLGLPGT